MAGQLHTSNGQLAYEIELEDQAIADRLINAIQVLYDIKASSHIVGPQGSTKKSRIQLRIGAGAKELTRRLGLVTRSGHPVVGLPPQVVSGSIADNEAAWRGAFLDRKSTRLNSSHVAISYAVFCLKKKKTR